MKRSLTIAFTGKSTCVPLLGYQLGAEEDRGGKDFLYYGKQYVKSAQVDHLLDEFGTTRGDGTGNTTKC